jgi:hypothetical protein
MEHSSHLCPGTLGCQHYPQRVENVGLCLR